MTDEEWWRADEQRLSAAIARHKRILDLADQNGWPCKVGKHQDLEGLWWDVPTEFVPIVGCMMARVE